MKIQTMFLAIAMMCCDNIIQSSHGMRIPPLSQMTGTISLSNLAASTTLSAKFLSSNGPIEIQSQNTKNITIQPIGDANYVFLVNDSSLSATDYIITAQSVNVSGSLSLSNNANLTIDGDLNVTASTTGCFVDIAKGCTLTVTGNITFNGNNQGVFVNNGTISGASGITLQNICGGLGIFTGVSNTGTIRAHVIDMQQIKGVSGGHGVYNTGTIIANVMMLQNIMGGNGAPGHNDTILSQDNGSSCGIQANGGNGGPGGHGIYMTGIMQAKKSMKIMQVSGGIGGQGAIRYQSKPGLGNRPGFSPTTGFSCSLAVTQGNYPNGPAGYGIAITGSGIMYMNQWTYNSLKEQDQIYVTNAASQIKTIFKK